MRPRIEPMKNKAKLTMRKSYGFRTCRALDSPSIIHLASWPSLPTNFLTSRIFWDPQGIENSPAADLVPIVGLPHGAKLPDIIIQGIPFRSGKVIVVQNMLDGGDGVIQIAFVKFSRLPVTSKTTQFLLGVVQPPTIITGKVPLLVAPVQVIVDAVDQTVHRPRLIAAVLIELRTGVRCVKDYKN